MGDLRGPQDLVPASTRYAERPRSVTTWRSDNVEAEQLERAEKARYGGEIGRDTAARQRTSRIYNVAITVYTRCAGATSSAVDSMRSSVASYQIFRFSILRNILCTCDSLSEEIRFKKKCI